MLNMKKVFDNHKKIKVLGVMLGMFLTIPAFASVAISPTRIEINANKIKNNYVTTAIDVKGDADKPIRFKAYAGYFKVNNNSEVVEIDDPSDVHNISKKVRFIPSEFTVAPGRTQKLRVNIVGLKAFADGENRAILYIEDVNPKEINIPTGREGYGAQLIVKSRMGIPIYVDKGKFTKNADIEYLNVIKASDGLYTDMKVLSKGTSKVRYTAKAQIVQGKKFISEYPIVGRVVPSNGFYIDKTKVDTTGVKESGEYTLRMIVSYFDEKGKRQNVIKETKINIVGKM